MQTNQPILLRNRFFNKGGADYLDTVLHVDAGAGNDELRAVRADLARCFGRIGCHLLPHPGAGVAERAEFAGCLDDMRPDFVEALRALVPGILAADRLVPKSFLGQRVTCSDLQTYIEVC